MGLKIYVYGSEELPIVVKTLELMSAKGAERVALPSEADVAVAPLLQVFLTAKQLAEPRLGTLIFHPSLLPRHRGRDAIKWAYKLGESYSGATWFWADEGMDTGDICEQEVLAIDPEQRPGAYYAEKVIPSAMRMLGYIIDDLSNGVVRRRPQQAENGTYEPPVKKA